MTDCRCQTLPAEFAWDPGRALLGGNTELIDRATSLELRACRSCGQLWRLALPPILAPHAWKMDTRAAWVEAPVRASPVAPESTLPILSTVVSALSTTWIERRSLLRLLVLPWALCVVGDGLLLLGTSHRPDMDPALIAGISYTGGFLITLVTDALFGIAWHRRILLNEGSASWLRCHAWTRAHAAFLAWSLALFVPALVSIAFFLTDFGDPWASIFGIPVWLGALYIVSRLSIALPATAVGAANDARSIWSLSQDAGIALVLVLVLAGIAACVLMIPIAILCEAAAPILPAAQFVLLPFRDAQIFLVTAIEISALSLSYKRLLEVRERQR